VPVAAKPPRSKEALQVGTQVRALRMAAGTSGGMLARYSGISRSLLSRIEHGLVSPSVETLGRIAGGLGVPVSRFFGDRSGRRDFSHVSAGRGIQMESGTAAAGCRWELLGHGPLGNLLVEPYLVTLLPAAGPQAIHHDAGVKFVYLLSGHVDYRYGERVVKLAPGDSLLFDAGVLHGIESIAPEPIMYLSVTFTLRG
jgi:transcriptional regulator with XRE-family HTH domain